MQEPMVSRRVVSLARRLVLLIASYSTPRDDCVPQHCSMVSPRGLGKVFADLGIRSFCCPLWKYVSSLARSMDCDRGRRVWRSPRLKCVRTQNNLARKKRHTRKICRVFQSAFTLHLVFIMFAVTGSRSLPLRHILRNHTAMIHPP
jgi:hypothetical protein